MPKVRLASSLALVAALVAVGMSAKPAHACDDETPERYRSAKTVWCVNPGIWAGHQADIEGFFPFGDQVVTKLIELFAIEPDNLPYTIEATEITGGAMTPSNFGPGVAVTGDAFYNELDGVVGFYGYLLVLHEFVNQWTGLVTPGWPTDWWADHRSPFPNSMDEQILRALGKTDAADLQHRRFSQQGDYDPEVEMFNQLFDAHGFPGLRRGFALIRQDGLRWDGLRDPPDYRDQSEFVSGNPSAMLSDYVTAYLSLGAGEELTAAFVAKTVGQQPPNWNEAWQDTTPTTANVTAIANAHCSIGAAAAAGGDVSSAREALQKGDYGSAQQAPTASCTSDCPSECACLATQACVAPWVDGATPQPDPDVDAGPGGGDDDGDDDGNPSTGDATGGCGCQAGAGSSAMGLGLAVLALIAIRRRR